MSAAKRSGHDLERWLSAQRWFGSASSDHLTVSEPLALPGRRAPALVTVTTPDHDRYQLLVPRGDAARPDVAESAEAADALVALTVKELEVPGPIGTVRGHWLPGHAPPGRAKPRPLGADQTNTSVVVGGTHVLKVLRRLTPGVHPEVEIGTHLDAQVAADVAATADEPLPVARLAGWYELEEPTGEVTVLGVVHHLVPGALDGWSLVLSGLAADQGALLTPLRELGVALARLHGALARPGPGTGFGVIPMDASAPTAVILHTADLLRQLEPTVDRHRVALTGRALELLAESLAAADLGVATRGHGDLHLGQTVVGPQGWVMFDFEGEPSRPLEDRRRHQSPLRDVAGLLRSLSYAVETVRRAGLEPGDGWEPAARAAVLDGYLASVDPSLLPRRAPAVTDLLTLFELERAVYETGYEVAHRPDWIDVPLTGLDRTLSRLRHRSVSS